MFFLRIVIIIIAYKFDTQNYYCLNVSLAALLPQTVPKTHHLRTILQTDTTEFGTDLARA